jgi:hypothetical protein
MMGSRLHSLRGVLLSVLSAFFSGADEIRVFDSQYTNIDYIKSVILTLEVPVSWFAFIMNGSMKMTSRVA